MSNTRKNLFCVTLFVVVASALTFGQAPPPPPPPTLPSAEWDDGYPRDTKTIPGTPASGGCLMRIKVNLGSVTHTDGKAYPIYGVEQVTFTAHDADPPPVGTLPSQAVLAAGGGGPNGLWGGEFVRLESQAVYNVRFYVQLVRASYGAGGPDLSAYPMTAVLSETTEHEVAAYDMDAPALQYRGATAFSTVQGFTPRYVYDEPGHYLASTFKLIDNPDNNQQEVGWYGPTAEGTRMVFVRVEDTTGVKRIARRSSVPLPSDAGGWFSHAQQIPADLGPPGHQGAWYNLSQCPTTWAPSLNQRRVPGPYLLVESPWSLIVY